MEYVREQLILDTYERKQKLEERHASFQVRSL